MTSAPRRFPPPWDIEERNAASFIVMYANRFPVCYLYFESEPDRRAAANLMTRDEARRVAANIYSDVRQSWEPNKAFMAWLIEPTSPIPKPRAFGQPPWAAGHSHDQG
jgi:hypothetical protein